MALYDRNYMRFEQSRSGWSMLGWLLAINLGVFLLQGLVTVLTQRDYLAENFSLSGESLLSGYVWTLLSYSVLHAVGNPMHIIFNMLGLFLIGRIVQKDIGEQKLLALYLFTALVGAFAFLMLNFDGAYLIGASAAVLGILTLYCLMHMEEQITLLLFFVLPVTLKPKFVLWGVLGIEIIRLFSEIQGTTYVAASAHLGGMLGAYIFYKHLLHRDTLFEVPKRPRAEPREPSKPRRKRRKVAVSSDKPRFTVNLNSRRELRSEVDRILDKINAEGFGALSEEEKRTLDQARDILSK